MQGWIPQTAKKARDICRAWTWKRRSWISYWFRDRSEKLFPYSTHFYLNPEVNCCPSILDWPLICAYLKVRMSKSIILYFFLFVSPLYQPCSKIDEHFSSYGDALRKVRSVDWAIEESVNTSKSSWIRAASFYSCDGKSGYFIIKTDSKEYIHQGLPVGVWREFKTASSFGSYYTKNIKNKYRLRLNWKCLWKTLRKNRPRNQTDWYWKRCCWTRQRKCTKRICVARSLQGRRWSRD